MAIGQPGRFAATQSHLARRAPASPMVLQHLMQGMANLAQKVDALAVSQEKAMSVRHAQAIARPVESREVRVESAESSLPQSQRSTKVNRSSLLDIFD